MRQWKTQPGTSDWYNPQWLYLIQVKIQREYNHVNCLNKLFVYFQTNVENGDSNSRGILGLTDIEQTPTSNISGK